MIISNLYSVTYKYAIELLKKNEIIAYPTEALFGIGCDPDSKIAVYRLLAFKKRSVEKGLILIAASFDQLKPYVDDSFLTLEHQKTIFSKEIRPITFVFPTKSSTPHWITGKFNSIAVRVTNHPTVVNLCYKFGKPLVSTSANISGFHPCRTIKEIYQQFGNTLPVVNGKTAGYMNPSEIRDILTGNILRNG